jgi:hypothetical protein
MDSMDNFRTRLEALVQQTKMMKAHTRTVKRRLRRWRAVTGSLLVLGLLIWALPTGVDVAAAQTVVHTGPITQMVLVRGPSCDPFCSPATTDSKEFVDVPNAFAQIRVEKTSVLIARFVSDSLCSAQLTIGGVLEPSYCSVRILVSEEPKDDFVEMVPSTQHFQIFQVHDGSGAHAIERSSFELSPGLYTVKVQFSIPFGIEPDAQFVLNGWHLTVEAASPR